MEEKKTHFFPRLQVSGILFAFWRERKNGVREKKKKKEKKENSSGKKKEREREKEKKAKSGERRRRGKREL